MQDHKDQFNSLRKKAIITSGVSIAFYTIYIFLGGLMWTSFLTLGLWIGFLMAPNETRTSLAKNTAIYVISLIATILSVLVTAFVTLVAFLGLFVVANADSATI